METLIVARGSEVKLALPKAEIKADGTIWMYGMPLLGIDNPAEREKYAAAIKARKYSSIPARYFTRLGNNDNGLWVGTNKEWQKQPGKLAANKAAAIKAAEAEKKVRIYLSSRGWGDFSPCEWRGDITRPDAEILAECKTLLETGHDVDMPNQTDNELITEIHKAREKWQMAPARKAAREKAEKEDLQRKVDSGFCFSCESWCHGDCGNYSNDPMVQMRRDMAEASREANFGINNEG
jgi:hypothetical protein